MKTRLGFVLLLLLIFIGKQSLGLFRDRATAQQGRQTAAIAIESAQLKIIEDVKVPAAKSGPLSNVLVKVGQFVKAGTVLAEIRQNEAKTQLVRAQIESKIAAKKASNDTHIQIATKTLKVAEKELERAVNANRDFANSFPQAEVDRRKLLVERNRLTIVQAKHEQALARLETDVKQNLTRSYLDAVRQHSIVAPLDGLVVSVERRKGEWVIPGDAVVRIVRVDRLHIEGFIHASKAMTGLQGKTIQLSVKVKGMNVKIHSTGKVIFVSPTVSPIDGRVRVIGEIDNAKGLLRPGLRPQAAITSEK